MTEVCFLFDPLRTPLAYDPTFKGEQNINIRGNDIFGSIYSVLTVLYFYVVVLSGINVNPRIYHVVIYKLINYSHIESLNIDQF